MISFRCKVLVWVLCASIVPLNCHYLINNNFKSSNPRGLILQNITKIVGGGVLTSPVTYQVSIQIPVYSEWQHTCGGSIISNSFVLTAAHCVDKKRPEKLTIVAGTNALDFGGVRHSVKSYLKHPSYYNNGDLVTNDIAVIKVNPPFTFGNKINKIKLAQNFGRNFDDHYPVTLTGWGSTFSNWNSVSLPKNLMFLNYNTITNDECRRKGRKVSLNEICALFGAGRGACVGDSGGPLVNRERNIQIGLVSYGSKNCATGSSDVYTRVSSHLQWIESAIKTLH